MIRHYTIKSAMSHGYLDDISYAGRILIITNGAVYQGYLYSSSITLLIWTF